MGFLEKFDVDMFLSYAARDNQLDWVTELHRKLKIRLEELLGKEVEIWFDKTRMVTGSMISNEIRDALDNTAILVVIVTPSYPESHWCQEELVTFQNGAEANAGLQIKNRLRIAKVVKTPWENNTHRQFFEDAVESIFYEPGEPHFREFRTDEPAFDDAIDHLAQDILGTLHLLRDCLTVYMAETSDALSNQCGVYIHELKARKFRVLPEHRLPDSEKEYASEVDRLLAQATLAIHLVDGSYLSNVNQQYENGRKLKLRHKLQQLVHISNVHEDSNVPKRIICPDSAHETFVNRLRDEDSKDSDEGLEVLVNKDPKEVLEVILEMLAPKKHRSVQRKTPDKRIYLIYDLEDFKDSEHLTNIRTLEKHIEQKGFEVELCESGEVAIQDNKNKLESCDGVLIYWGLATPEWVHEKVDELVQAVGFRHYRSFAAKALFMVGPADDMKKNFKHEADILTIPDFEKFTVNKVDLFLEQLAPKPRPA